MEVLPRVEMQFVDFVAPHHPNDRDAEPFGKSSLVVDAAPLSREIGDDKAARANRRDDLIVNLGVVSQLVDAQRIESRIANSWLDDVLPQWQHFFAKPHCAESNFPTPRLRR